ncbi:MULTISPECIES: sensor domain-containing protein [Rhizobium]|uniref:sensor domain-containing protein n=1 Tax=Rhizobium TaxID=379 RepID=UPI0007EB6B38|nr:MULTISPECIES: EAL domain-containing protein [Rhizobium]ANK90714.1 GGDEF/EAL domain-containing protein [Rhizobium sp. N6212]ANK96743.1 GGDEF/EAL domain-containing protein [Rhizobium sp. N621]ANL02863.1 GGDEF/EAL domain-containing protein [Rhizobium esperanzae]ANL08912.1 GGDEF/EAL domain-containing protein [Rhizobium sp. N1341]ANL20959.1 GGDEF/EAL domain-containing protein [Rhizobium sp. N113]
MHEASARQRESVDSLTAETRRFVAATEAMMASTAHHLSESVENLRLKAIIHELPDFLYVKDRDSRFVFANAVTASHLGFTRAEEITGKRDFDLFDFEVARRHFDIEQQIMASGQARIDMEETVVLPGSPRPVCRLTSKIPLRNDRGEVVGLIGVSRDITERKLQEDLHRGQAKLLEMIARNEPLPMILEALVLMIEAQLTGIDGSVLLLDSEGTRLYHGAAPNLPGGYSRLIDGVTIGPKVGSCGTAAWRGQPVIVEDVMSDPLWEDFRGLVAPFGFRSCWSTPIATSENNVLGTFALYSREVRHPTEHEMRLVALATHIAGIAIERKRVDDRIHFMAHHDDLTGLPNRAFLKERLAGILDQARRNNRKVTVAYIDLDNFKDINDGRGHAAGDEVLKEIATRMANSIRPSDMVVRLGGDEFLVVLVHQSSHDAGITRRLRDLQKAITRPMRDESGDITITSSIGVAAFPVDGVTSEELLANADRAMYRAKQFGRNTLQHHDGDSSGVGMPRGEQDELHQAITGDQLFLEYQPQVDVATGRITGVEALVRWNHPAKGRVPPVNFIPLAEETGLIVPLGLWVLNEACRQARSWQDMGLTPLTIAVNVSAKQFADPDFASHVAEALERNRLQSRWLELEVTESVVMQDAERALAMMEQLRALGVRLSIDDFGSGYSSLAALKTFPFDRLKMDRSLVEALPGDETAVAIASAVISLAQKLKLSVLAEGVETDAQMDFLRQAQCKEAQGYRFSKPVPPEEVSRMLQTQLPWNHAP